MLIAFPIPLLCSLLYYLTEYNSEATRSSKLSVWSHTDFNGTVGFLHQLEKSHSKTGKDLAHVLLDFFSMSWIYCQA